MGPLKDGPRLYTASTGAYVEPLLGKSPLPRGSNVVPFWVVYYSPYK